MLQVNQLIGFGVTGGGGTGVVVGSPAVAFASVGVGAGYTIVDRSVTLPAGEIFQIGIYQLHAGSYKFKVVQEDSTTQFDCDFFNQAVSHGGAGWQDFAVSGSLIVPGVGTYKMAVYNTPTTISLTTSAFARALLAGDQTAADTGSFTAATDQVVALRVTY